jgi:AraC-like DNA-binding protein
LRQKIDLDRTKNNISNMSKYNITEIKPKVAHYRTLVNPALMDELRDKIIGKIIVEKKYKQKDYSAQVLAEELGTNTRYISAVVNVKFHMNYTSLVNKYRVEEAMTLLSDRRYAKLTIEEVSDMVGFSNRQSFYASFFRILGTTPREYRLNNMPPEEKKAEKKAAKPKKQKVVKKAKKKSAAKKSVKKD